MAEVLKATTRTERGTRKARELRAEGLVPAVLYGHGEGTVSLTLNARELRFALRHGEKLIDVELDGKHENVLIKTLQWDTWGKEVLHLDLTRVNLDELVTVTVKITLLGTPVGVEAGGSLQQPMASMDIECRVDQIPEEIRIQVNELKVDDAIHLSDVELPEGAKLLGNPDALVCGVVTIAEEVEAEEGEEGEESDGPEVIGAKPDEEDEE